MNEQASREEFVAAVAALRLVAERLEHEDCRKAVEALAEPFEEAVWDAPPIKATGELTDDVVLSLIQTFLATGAGSILVGAAWPLRVR